MTFLPHKSYGYGSALTVYQILTGENWNNVMYTTMEGSHPTAALYFVFTFIIGNWMVLNLFVAVLAEGFKSEDKSVDFIDSRDDEEMLQTAMRMHGGMHRLPLDIGCCWL